MDYKVSTDQPRRLWTMAENVPMPQTPPLPASEDPVNHPKHYTNHPSGVACIQITRHMNFNLGNVFKYIWRSDIKHQAPVEDLKKARWYLNDEISRLEKDDAVEDQL